MSLIILQLYSILLFMPKIIQRVRKSEKKKKTLCCHMNYCSCMHFLSAASFAFSLFFFQFYWLVKEDDATPCWYNFREHLTIWNDYLNRISVQDKCFACGILFPEINASSHEKKKLWSVTLSKQYNSTV